MSDPVAVSAEDFSKWVARLSADKVNVLSRIKNKDVAELLWASIGLSKESAEVLEHVSDHIFYGTELSKFRLADELGDLLFHLVTVCNALQIDMPTLMAVVQAKNNTRYPEGVFSEERAKRENRNREAEQTAMQDAFLKGRISS